MNKPETIVIMTPGFAESENDTSCLPMHQRFVKTLCRLYSSLSVTVLAFQYPFHRKEYYWNNARVIPLNGRNRGWSNRLMLQQLVKNQLDQIHATSRIKGFLSFWYGPCSATAKRFASKFNIPHRCWILGQDARDINPYPRKLHLPAEELIALSDNIRHEFYQNHHVSPQHLIPPGVDPDDFSSSGHRDIDLLSVGSLIPLKRFEIFIETTAFLAKHISNLRTVIVGDGPERGRLEELARSYGTQDHIYFTGALPYPEVLDLMSRAKILLHPSSYEGFSGVCQEALASGAHVISFVRAMDHDIRQWHIVSTIGEMNQKALDLLSSPKLVHQPVIPYTMEDTVKKMMELF